MEEDTQCLFCKNTTPAASETFVHMANDHGFEFEAIRKEKGTCACVSCVSVRFSEQFGDESYGLSEFRSDCGFLLLASKVFGRFPTHDRCVFEAVFRFVEQLWGF